MKMLRESAYGRQRGRDGSPTCGTRAVRQIGDGGSPLHLGSGHLHPGSELLPHRGSGLLGSSQPFLGGVQPHLGSGHPRLGSVQARLGSGHRLRQDPHGGDHGGESAVGITEDVAGARGNPVPPGSGRPPSSCCAGRASLPHLP